MEVCLHALSQMVRKRVVEPHAGGIGEGAVWSKPELGLLAREGASRRSQSRRGQAGQCMGRTKGGLNTKLAAVVDSLGRVVGLHVAPGNRADLAACEVLFDHLRGRWVLADKAFDCDALRRKLAGAGCRACIPPKSNRKIQYYYSKELYKLRHVVENFFCRIKFNKRVFTRYEKLAETFLGFVTIAVIIDWIKFEI